MRKSFVGFVVLGLCLALSCMTAQAQTELKIVSGTVPTAIAIATTPPNVVTYSNGNFDGWNIQIEVGTSHTPGLQPFGIDLFSATIMCITGPCKPLDVFVSDKGFTQVVNAGGFFTTYLSNQSGTGASTSQKAWDNPSNAIFDTMTLVGTIGPFTGTGPFTGLAKGGGPAGSAPYSLTLEDIFNGGTGATFSLNNGLLGATTPEPTSMLLMGTGLLAMAGLIRRRKA